jgi:hypothetical protein
MICMGRMWDVGSKTTYEYLDTFLLKVMKYSFQGDQQFIIFVDRRQVVLEQTFPLTILINDRSFSIYEAI